MFTADHPLCGGGVGIVGGAVGGQNRLRPIIALASGYYLVDQCIINFEGDWGWSKAQSETTPINSIGSFLIFGLPCLIYTMLGRFTLRKEEEVEDDFDWDDVCEDDADVRERRTVRMETPEEVRRQARAGGWIENVKPRDY